MERIIGLGLIVGLIYIGLSVYKGDFGGGEPAPTPTTSQTQTTEPPRRPTAQEVLAQYGAPSARSAGATGGSSGSANVMPRRGGLPQYVKHKVTGALEASERRAETR